MSDLLMTVQHPYSGQTIQPVSGDIVLRDGAWRARILASNGQSFIHPTAFASKIKALDFVNLTMSEGAGIV